MVNVIANDNGSDGIEVGFSASIVVAGTAPGSSTFNDNSDDGIDIFSTPIVIAPENSSRASAYAMTRCAR